MLCKTISKLNFLFHLGSCRTLSVGAYIGGKNPYTTPVRKIILSNEYKKKLLKVKRETADVKDSNHDKVDIFFHNRNPRHLDLLGFNKPSGFTTLHESRNFYNKLNLQMTNCHTKAYVENINGQILCYASTTEHYIARRLHSTTDVCAIVNIARILAERLKQVGVVRVHWCTRLDRTTEKIREFEGILNNNGIILSEAPLKVLQGTSQTLPPPRRERQLPGPMRKSVKNRGTILRKDKDR
ncbi:39S ribosomal protein L18, mitochondrial-like [Hydractinia symbiolongicarpus]|uniref:39S ribosomal protein L18, mitochondrial-like n=1 Tax=Hydractinia symbiolongicarpus TaxID=13093 RepID=UPI00254EF4A3|nr:39S ribosomal protein L18, mitochondrial-like [Hydractinia symbiolongicarpus]